MVAETKKRLLVEMKAQLQAAHIVALVDMQNLPAPQLQAMRASLRGNVQLLMARKRLLQRALLETKKDVLSQRIEGMHGMPALLVTNDNPFKLYKTLQKNKSPAPAKPNQVAPNDIIVKAGPTSFAPGPVIGELASIGIKTGVEAGKITIKEDAVVVKEGQQIKPKVAEILRRLDVKPMEIGLNLLAVFENGTVFDAKVLAIDEDEYAANIAQAAQWAMALAMEAAYTAKDTIGLLLSKASGDARALAIGQNIMADAVREELLSKAERQAQALKLELNI